MDVRKILVGAAVAAGITLSGAGSGVGTEGIEGGGSLDCEPVPEEEIFDDFADGEVFDGDPVQWVMAPCCPGQYPPAEGGGVEVRPDRSTGVSPVFRTERILTGDISVRIRGSFNGTSFVTDPVVPFLAAMLHTSPSGPSAYSGEVYLNREIRIGKYPEGNLTVGRLDFDPKDGDLYIELSRRGNDLELRVWRADDAGPEVGRPEEPQLPSADPSYQAGYAGFMGWFGDGNPIILRSLWIARKDCIAGPFIRGDSNDDGKVDISDAVQVLSGLFLGGPDPGCKAAANVNGDGKVNTADPVYLLDFLFLGGPAPAAPYPYCGPGDLPADKTLGCEIPPENCQ